MKKEPKDWPLQSLVSQENLNQPTTQKQGFYIDDPDFFYQVIRNTVSELKRS